MRPDFSSGTGDKRSNFSQDCEDNSALREEHASQEKVVETRKVRKHGFQFPFHPLQILAWAVTGLDVYCFYFINTVVFGFNPAISAVLGLVFGLTLVLVAIFACKATKCDPTDPTVYRQREAEKQG